LAKNFEYNYPDHFDTRSDIEVDLVKSRMITKNT